MRAWQLPSAGTTLNNDTEVIPLGMAMTLRLTPEDDQALTQLAEVRGVSKQEAAIRAIHDAAARHGHQEKVSQLSAAARARYASLLERLGQ